MILAIGSEKFEELEVIEVEGIFIGPSTIFYRVFWK